MPSRTLHVLTGCTASGKTEWALRWAEANDAEIISCDSLLFYRGMDIGTAKPTAAERARVPHHLVDILEVGEPMNVARYAGLARAAAESIALRGRRILVVGGSGFYLKSFLAPVADAIEVSAEIRAGVAASLAGGGLKGLVEELAKLNPGGLGSLDTANPRRVARALERCLASGRTLSELAADFARLKPAFGGWEVKVAELRRGPEELARRAAARVEGMLQGGLVGEVRGLLARGLKDNPSASRAIGYREVIAMFEGRLAAKDLASEIEKDTRALVKKQLTWFRTQLPAHRVLAAGELEDPRALFSPEA
ncbi:MAG: tRNA (adenosine(37)-N6)-dimethylallyltransferase MiaA [Opitutaceae bacterium]|jgi:tRNA dimethylallyltransferase